MLNDVQTLAASDNVDKLLFRTGGDNKVFTVGGAATIDGLELQHMGWDGPEIRHVKDMREEELSRQHEAHTSCISRSNPCTRSFRW